MDKQKKQLEEVGRRISEIRRKIGWSQYDLAEKSDRSLPLVQRWEQKGEMTLRTIFMLAGIMKCHPGEFFKEPKTAKLKRGRPRENKRRYPGRL